MAYNHEHLKAITAFHLRWGKPYFVNILYPNVIRSSSTIDGKSCAYAWTRGGENPEYIEVVWCNHLYWHYVRGEAFCAGCGAPRRFEP